MFGLSMVFLMTRRPPRSTRTDTRVPHTPLCRSDGRNIPPAMLRELLASRGGTGWLLVDEAFADFDPALSIAPAVNDDARLILFRSFGKFFGFAGVRLGFVLGPGPVLHDLRALDRKSTRLNSSH